jgi:hypothetical protein
VKKFLVAASLLAAMCVPAWAEPAKDQPKVKTIFDYKQELSLSDEQISSMKAQLSELNTSVKTSRELLTKLENDYRALIAKDSTTPAQAKVKLEEIADATVTMRLKDLEISRKITGTMSADQREKWKAIQAKVRAAQPKP